MYEITHKFVKHRFETKIFKNDTMFIHCIRAHDSEFGTTNPSFKIIHLINQKLIWTWNTNIRWIKLYMHEKERKEMWYLRHQFFTKLRLKHFKCINSCTRFSHYTSKTCFSVLFNCSEKWWPEKGLSIHSIYLPM